MLRLRSIWRAADIKNGESRAAARQILRD